MIRLRYLFALLLAINMSLCLAQETMIICGRRTPGFYINNKFIPDSVEQSLGSDSLPYLSEAERSVMHAWPRGASRRRAKRIGPNDLIVFVDGAVGHQVDKRMFFEILMAPENWNVHVSVHTDGTRTVIASWNKRPPHGRKRDQVLASSLVKD